MTTSSINSGFNSPAYAESGSIEALVVLPLFLIFICGIALTAMMLLERTHLQKSAWLYGMEKAHTIPDTEAFKHAEEMFTEGTPNNALTKTDDTDCFYELASMSPNRSQLPIVFRTALLASCSSRNELSAKSLLPAQIANYLKAGDPAGFARNPIESVVLQRTTIWTRGSAFKDSTALKHALWQKDMAQAGFGLLPLSMLGVPELLKAASIVGFGGLGSAAEIILNQYGVLKKSESLPGTTSENDHSGRIP